MKLHQSDLKLHELTVWGLIWNRAHIVLLAFLLIGVNRACVLAWPFLSKYLVDDVLTQRSRSTLLVLVGLGGLATLIQGVSAYLINRTVNISSLGLLAYLRNRIHYHVLHLSTSYYDASSTGTLVARIMNDVDGVRSILGGGFISFLGGVLTAAIAFVILVQINATMTLCVFLIMVPFIFLLRNRVNKNRPLYKDASAVRAELSGRLTESLGGMRVVKAYRAEHREHDIFRNGMGLHLEKVIAIAKAQGFLDLIVVLMTGVVSGGVMYFGGSAIMAGEMTLGDFFRYVMLLSVLVAPLLQAVSIGMQFNEAIAGLDRIRELMAEPTENHNGSRYVKTGKLKGEVCFDSVSFSYVKGVEVLHEVCFRAEPGTVTALVGRSGAGKSTIIGLIAGFYEASGGSVLVNDINISKADLDSYRANLGFVPQETFLFNGSIRENVAFSRPDASDEEVINACRIAHVDEFANRFEEGYDTQVGERGVKLSMGERQRIAIARAILVNPKILILDEATSSLDSVSEAAVQQALSYLFQERTAFVIAHRLSTIRRADQILVVDSGRIVEYGTHDALLRARGKYWELYTLQHELQSNLFLAPGEGIVSAAERGAN